MARRYLLVSRWGAACGISLHGELLAQGLRSIGADVTVYAPTVESASRDWHHVVIEGDPPWVHRVYDEVDEIIYPDGGGFRPKHDPRDFDVIVVEGYQRLPWRAVEGYIREAVKAGVATLLVVHYSLPRDVEPVLEEPGLWTRVLVFDERFERLVKSVSGDVETSILPYPHLIIDVDEVDRPDVGDARILFSFGRQPQHEYVDYVRGVKRLVERGYRLVYRVVRSLGRLGYKAPWFIEEERRLDTRSLYAALRGSDIHLLPKWDSPGVVMSSTLAQTLYSGVPTIVPDTRYFENVPDALREKEGVVVKYRLGDVRDLVSKLELLLEDEGLARRVSENARRYALERSPERIAEALDRLVSRL